MKVLVAFTYLWCYNSAMEDWLPPPARSSLPFCCDIAEGRSLFYH